MFERILYIWAIRHPASGYVQGINDLVTPFFVVFLSEYVDSNREVSSVDLSALNRNEREAVEADSFWCVSFLLDTIQDNYTFAQPGIQMKVRVLENLVGRVDSKWKNAKHPTIFCLFLYFSVSSSFGLTFVILDALHLHLIKHQVEYLQFAFRWMNNLLMREIPLRATIRLWDTYLVMIFKLKRKILVLEEVFFFSLKTTVSQIFTFTFAPHFYVCGLVKFANKEIFKALCFFYKIYQRNSGTINKFLN